MSNTEVRTAAMKPDSKGSVLCEYKKQVSVGKTKVQGGVKESANSFQS